MKRASFQRPDICSTAGGLRSKLEAQVHAPLIRFAQPLRAAAKAPEVVFTAFLTPFLRRIGETLMSQVRMRSHARKTRVNALASQAHNAH